MLPGVEHDQSGLEVAKLHLSHQELLKLQENGVPIPYHCSRTNFSIIEVALSGESLFRFLGMTSDSTHW